MSIAGIITPSNADGLPVTIQELAGPQVEFVLAGKNSPETGVVVEDRAVTHKTHYPGNNEATIHSMGMEYGDIVLKGRFADPFDQFIGGARRRVELLRGLQHRENYCRLTWGENIVRVGRIKTVRTTNMEHNRIGYEIVFEVAVAEEVGSEFDNNEVLGPEVAQMEKALRASLQAMDAALTLASAVATQVRYIDTFRRRRPPPNRNTTTRLFPGA